VSIIYIYTLCEAPFKKPEDKEESCLPVLNLKGAGKSNFTQEDLLF